MLESDYPYRGSDNSCKESKSKEVAKPLRDQGYYYVNANEGNEGHIKALD